MKGIIRRHKCIREDLVSSVRITEVRVVQWWVGKRIDRLVTRIVDARVV